MHYVSLWIYVKMGNKRNPRYHTVDLDNNIVYSLDILLKIKKEQY